MSRIGFRVQGDRQLDYFRRCSADRSEMSIETFFGGDEGTGDAPTGRWSMAFSKGKWGWTVESGSYGFPPRCVGYGVTRRLGRGSLMPAESADACESLFRDDANLIDAEEWLLRTDYSASKPSEVQDVQRKRLEQVRRILIDLLPDIEDVRVSQPTAKTPVPAAEFHTPYGWVSLGELSQGYQSLIAWMVDFAARMMERYPASDNPLAEPAVLLVDEIDLHLHPKWQRQVVEYLSRLFPRTQFVVTAHSPLIVQGAGADANVAVLRREGDHVVIDNDVEAVRGWRVDQILTSDLFDLPTSRPPEFDDLLKRRTELLGKAELTPDEEAEIARLERQLDALPPGETADEARRMLKLAEESHELLKKYGG